MHSAMLNALILIGLLLAQPAAAAQPEFSVWLEAFAVEARDRGISQPTLDASLANVERIPAVIELDRRQPKEPGDFCGYMDARLTRTRIARGRLLMKQHRTLLHRVSSEYGVPARFVVALWGLETNFGDYQGEYPVIDVLATLAYDERRGALFRKQLLAALRIVDEGHQNPADLKGSWAGAMGHTQFIPTSYQAYAVDFRGDGKRDIWSDDPTDALASTAAYLRNFGWRKGQPWGVEVTLPKGFNYSLTGERIKKSPTDWAALGVRDTKGRKVPNHGRASILLPAGGRGAAFMIFNNFHVIERYNTADAYVIGVGHLSDRIAGAGKLKAGWPRDDRNLRFTEKQEMQRRLTAKGYNTHGVDGIIGPNTIAAIRRFQSSEGMVPDGYASFEILRRLR